MSFQAAKLTYTTVSSGRAARRLFSASCISAALPSKNLPHPEYPISFPEPIPNKRTENSRGGWLTTDEERVACKDGLARAILHVVADAVLGVAGRVDSLDGNVTNLKDLLVLWGLSDALAVFAADNVELRVAQILELRVV